MAQQKVKGLCLAQTQHPRVVTHLCSIHHNSAPTTGKIGAKAPSWKGSMSDISREGKRILLALGANLPSRWGEPPYTFERAIALLQSAGFAIEKVSKLYKTRAVGPGKQNIYYNCVLSGQTRLSPAALMRTAKAIEAQAGRRRGRTWGPRVLDIDIIDYRGRRLGQSPIMQRIEHRVPGRLVLPHPEAHRRAFVLVPLRDVEPAWRHPVSRKGLAAMIEALPLPTRKGVGPGLAFSLPPCNKNA